MTTSMLSAGQAASGLDPKDDCSLGLGAVVPERRDPQAQRCVAITSTNGICDTASPGA